MPAAIAAVPLSLFTDSAPRWIQATGKDSVAPQDDFAAAVLQGLSRPLGQRALPCRFFYDETGSALFEEITALPEYYPTRTERALLAAYAPDMIQAAAASQSVALVELGSGSSAKTRLLLDAALQRQERLHYTAIDISAHFLSEAALALLQEYREERLSVTAVAGEYGAGLASLPEEEPDSARLFLFLGSNIGNFDTREAVAFLARIHAAMRPQDRLLLGIDLVKDISTLEAAYNDAAGVTAAFNKNLLVRINREMDGDFQLDRWQHRAPWVPERSRIEMHLVSAVDQTVSVRDSQGERQTFAFQAGESIHTESSHKYTRAAFDALCRQAGLQVTASWMDPHCWFSMVLTAPRTAA